MKRSIHVSPHMLAHAQVVLEIQCLLQEHQGKMTYMSNEATHRIVITLTDHGLGESLVSWPVTLVILRECVAQVYQHYCSHTVGVVYTVLYCTYTTNSCRITISLLS